MNASTVRGSHVTGAGHTGITVSDLGRAVRYFRDALGLAVTEPVEARGELFERVTGVDGCVIDICFADAGNHTIELLCYRGPDGRASSALRPCDNGHLHLCLDVDDIDAVIEAGRPHGFEPVGPVQAVASGPHAGTRVIYARGPDSLTIEFMQHPPS